MNYGNAKKSEASKSDVWETPPELVKALEGRYGKFVLDVAASPENAKAPLFFTEKDNALEQDWTAPIAAEPGVIFCNPPYSRGNKPAFLKKARETASAPGKVWRKVVCVIPAGTGDKWFHETVLEELYAHQDLGLIIELVHEGPLKGTWLRADGVEVGFLKGRVKFRSPLNPDENGSTGGTAIVAFLP